MLLPILPPGFAIGMGWWTRLDWVWWLVFPEIRLPIRAAEFGVNTGEAGEAAGLGPDMFEDVVAGLAPVVSEGPWLALVSVRERVAYILMTLRPLTPFLLSMLGHAGGRACKGENRLTDSGVQGVMKGPVSERAWEMDVVGCQRTLYRSVLVV